ncbi:MAG: hypothetical protein AAGA58_15865 [Verrucomicrobiota bacterium]
MIHSNADLRLRGGADLPLSRQGFLEAIREASRKARSKAEKDELGEVVKKLRLEWVRSKEREATG